MASSAVVGLAERELTKGAVDPAPALVLRASAKPSNKITTLRRGRFSDIQGAKGGIVLGPADMSSRTSG
jgi:hypothetical protein